MTDKEQRMQEAINALGAMIISVEALFQRMNVLDRVLSDEDIFTSTLWQGKTSTEKTSLLHDYSLIRAIKDVIAGPVDIVDPSSNATTPVPTGANKAGHSILVKHIQI